MLGLCFFGGRKNTFFPPFCCFISGRSAETTPQNILAQNFKSFLKSLISNSGVHLHQIRPHVVQLQWLPTPLNTPFAADLLRPKFEVTLTFWLPQSTVLQLPITCLGNLTAKEWTSNNASYFVNYVGWKPLCCLATQSPHNPASFHCSVGFGVNAAVRTGKTAHFQWINLGLTTTMW